MSNEAPRRRGPVDQVAGFFNGLLGEALPAAHQRGVIYYELGGANILLGERVQRFRTQIQALRRK